LVDDYVNAINSGADYEGKADQLTEKYVSEATELWQNPAQKFAERRIKHKVEGAIETAEGAIHTA